MHIKSIEPTPSPNTMKINLNEELPSGMSNNYKQENQAQAPALIQAILHVDGVKAVYHVADFLAVERNAKFDWKDILSQIRTIFGEEGSKTSGAQSDILESFGEITVSVQQFKGIPMQIKLQDGESEKRFGLPDYFSRYIEKAQKPDDNVVLMRKWKDYGVRYGDMEEIGEEVRDEITAAYTEERLNSLIKQLSGTERKNAPQRSKVKLTAEALSHPEWEKRYQALDSMPDPVPEDIPLLTKALDDPKVSIRRLAVVYLGMIEDKKVLPALFKALKDRNPAVRRTAGDCLSDLGFDEGMTEMASVLKDKSKIVRWRAAMYLYEVGNETVLPALKEASDDPEFEVALQVRMAIDRIENGEAAKGSVWKQMTEARQQNQ